MLERWWLRIKKREDCLGIHNGEEVSELFNGLPKSHDDVDICLSPKIGQTMM